MESGSTVQLPLVLTIYEVELFWEVHESLNPWPAQGWISAFKLLSPNSVVPKESFLPKRLNMLVLLIRLITFSFSTSKRLSQQISMKTWRLFLNSTKGNLTSVSLLNNIVRLNVLHEGVFLLLLLWDVCILLSDSLSISSQMRQKRVRPKQQLSHLLLY